MSRETRRGLLGRLAGLGWFTANGEPATTQALAMLLEDPALREPLLRRAEDITGADLRDVRWFEPESVQDDLGRPDLEGVDHEGRPLLVIEAKFGAPLSTGQVRSYLDHQQRRVTAGISTAMLILVPTSREAEARKVLDATRAERSAANLESYRSKTGVITWDDWLSVWDAAVADLPATPTSIAGDLHQLRELCVTLGGLVVAPFGDVASTVMWRAREKDFLRVFDHLSVRLKEPSSRMPGIVHELGYDPMRYFSGGYGNSALSIGVASRFGDAGGSPLWLRFHSITPEFIAIRQRLMTSDYAELVRHEDGHLWVPLTVDGDLSGPELVETLLDQVYAIRSAVSSPAWGLASPCAS